MLAKNGCLSVLRLVFTPFLTIAVAITVTKNVHISIISKREISLIVSKNPAITGETRYLALPASETSPFALENSSLERISVIVDRYAGSNSEENIAASAAYVHDVLPDAKMELLPYHSLGRIKYEAIGMPFEQDGLYTPDKEEMKKLRGIAAAQGVTIADYR